MPDEYTGSFAPGDRVVVTEDREDGSWVGAEGTVIKTYFQKGGTFAPDRSVEIVIPDDEDTAHLADTAEGRATLAAKYDDGEAYCLSSDEFEFEAL